MAKRTWLERLNDAVRSYWSGPLTAKSPELARLWGGGSSSSGISVSEHSAMSYSAVFAAVALIADDISSLPLMLYKKLPTGGKDRFESHPLYRLLHDEPNTEMGTMTFRQTLTGHVLLWGNGYAEIVRNGAGYPTRLWPITPDRVSPFRDGAGALKYRVMNPSGAESVIDSADMIHIHGIGFDGICGYSVIEKARESIGLGLASEKFGSTFFGNGSTFGGVISYPQPANQEVQDNTRKAVESRHQGVEKAHKFLTLYNGAKYERLGIPPNDAQFLETRVFQIREIARWFKLPPHKLADLADATFSNVEQQNLDYYTSCLRPWLELWEQELSRKLISKLERNQQFIEHEVKGLLKADAQGRATLYQALFNVGAITPNEIRNLENMDPIKGGDQAFVQMNNLVPIGRVDEIIDAQIKEKEPREFPPQAPAAPTEDQVNAFIAAMEKRLSERDATLTEEVSKRAEAEAMTDVAIARVAEVKSALEACEANLVTARDAQASIVGDVASLQQIIAEREAALESEQSSRVSLETEAASLREAKGILEQANSAAEESVRQLQAAVDLERAKLAAAEEAEQRRIAELGEAQLAVLAAEARARDLETQKAAADAVNSELRSQALDAQELRDALLKAEAEQAATQAALAALQGTQGEKEAVEARAVDLSGQVQASDAVIAELRVRIQETEGLREALTKVEQQRADIASKVSESGAVMASIRERDVTAVQAHRDIYAEVMGRLIRRETAKARAYQATAPKLRAWVESFYDQSEAAIFVEALLPCVRLHLVWLGDHRDVAEVTQAIVDQHFEESRSRIVKILDAGDNYGELLQRLLAQWESRRAETFADGLAREEMVHGEQ